MPVQLYETLFAIDTGKMATDADSIKQSFHVLIEKLGGEILVSRPWNVNQKLSYAIRKQKKGYYYIIYYNLESTKQQEMESEIRLTMSDFLLRHMTSFVDHRYAEVMLSIAREDQGPSFALKMMHDEPSPTDILPSTINDPNAPSTAPLGEIGPVPMLDAPPRRPRRTEGAEKPA